MSRAAVHGPGDHETAPARPAPRAARDRMPPRAAPSGVLALQAAAGNRAVAALLHPPVAVQRATVSGVRNDHKTATEIGTDVHNLVQDAFLDSDLGHSFNLYREMVAGPGLRADMVAVNDERDDDGLGDLWIYVGEIKSAANQYYAGGKAYHQLGTYVAAFRRGNPTANVGNLTFWNPDADGYVLHGGGYDCVVYVSNPGGGVYHYEGRSTEKGQRKQSDRIEEEGEHDLPFNELPNYAFM